MENKILVSKKAKSGTFWSFMTTLVSRSLGFIFTIVATRLLSPDDYGIMAIVLGFMAIFQSTTQTGFPAAIIQKKDNYNTLLNTAWTVEVIRFTFLFFIFNIFASPIAEYFNNENLKLYIHLTSFSYLFLGFRNIGVVYLRKNLDFFRLFLFESTPLILRGISTVILAFYFRNIWALIFGKLIGDFVLLLSSYYFHHYRPKFELNLKKFNVLANFGVWILFSTIIGSLRKNIIYFFIGRNLGFEKNGLFERSQTFSTLIFNDFADILWRIGFPILSKIQSSSKDVSKFFLKMLNTALLFGFPITIGLYFVADELVYIFLGNEWIAISEIIKVFSLFGFISFVAAPYNILTQSMGFPKILTYASSISLLFLISSFVYLSYLSLNLLNIAYAVILSDIIYLLIIICISFTFIKINYLNNINIFFGIFISNLSLAFVLNNIDPLIRSFSDLESLFIKIITGVIVYVSTFLSSKKLLSIKFEKLLVFYDR